MTEVGLGFSLRRPALIKCSIPSGPSIVLLTLFSGELVLEWHQTMKLLKSKCLPILYYGMEACPLRKSQFKSLDFVINSALMKIFDTKSQDIADACREIFNCLSAESAIASRRWNFLGKLTCRKISYTALLLMSQKNFLRYDKRGCSTQLTVISCRTETFLYNYRTVISM